MSSESGIGEQKCPGAHYFRDVTAWRVKHLTAYDPVFEMQDNKTIGSARNHRLCGAVRMGIGLR